MTHNESYDRFRQQALDFNQHAKEYCFCGGNGNGCCKRGPLMLEEDKEVILEAIQHGEIDQDTVIRAKERAADSTEPFCSFLGDNGECTIYPYRPIICIQHGNGGLPKEETLINKAVSNPGNKTIKTSEMIPFCCANCFAELNPNERVPLRLVGTSLKIYYAYEQTPLWEKTSIENFVKNELPEATATDTGRIS